MKKKSKKKMKVSKRNPVAKALRTPRFRSRVELDRKKEMKKNGTPKDEE
jgi:stalled ribosome alternative rescue factor ArfA